MKNKKINLGFAEGLKVVGIWKWEVRDVAGSLVRRGQNKNLMPLVGLTALAAQISGQNSTTLGDNLYIAVGSDATPPIASNTTLDVETARKAVGSSSFSGGTASIAVFFGFGEATGTHREFGLFGDGNASVASAAADSGILYSHVPTNTSVSALETLTLTFEINFTSA